MAYIDKKAFKADMRNQLSDLLSKLGVITTYKSADFEKEIAKIGKAK